VASGGAEADRWLGQKRLSTRPGSWHQSGMAKMKKNAEVVAMEAGNSPQMILKHYRELVRPKGAKEWFAITSKTVEEALKQGALASGERPGNVVSLSKVKAAA
jgi:hypothetical protein